MGVCVIERLRMQRLVHWVRCSRLPSFGYRSGSRQRPSPGVGAVGAGGALGSVGGLDPRSSLAAACTCQARVGPLPRDQGSGPWGLDWTSLGAAAGGGLEVGCCLTSGPASMRQHAHSLDDLLEAITSTHLPSIRSRFATDLPHPSGSILSLLACAPFSALNARRLRSSAFQNHDPSDAVAQQPSATTTETGLIERNVGAANNMSIQPLPGDVIAQIKSSTAVTSLNGAVCGLLQNSLDASASRVNIAVDYSRGNCSVEDDGDGIAPESFRENGGLGKLHCMSLDGAWLSSGCAVDLP